MKKVTENTGDLRLDMASGIKRKRKLDLQVGQTIPETWRSVSAAQEAFNEFSNHNEHICPGVATLSGAAVIEPKGPATKWTTNGHPSSDLATKVKFPITENSVQGKANEVLISAVMVDDPEQGFAHIVKAEPLRGTVWKRAVAGLFLVSIVAGTITFVLLWKVAQKSSSAIVEDHFEPLVTVSLQLDEAPHEIGWQLSCDGEVIADQPVGSYGVPYELDQQNFEVNEGSQCTFQIEDSQGNGLCCYNGTGYYKVHVGADTLDPNSIRAEGAEFGFEEISRFAVKRYRLEVGVFAGNQTSSYRGFSLALSADGTTMATGAPGLVSDELGNTDVGHVQVVRFDTETRTWTALGHVLADAGPGEYFGFSVALSSVGNRVAIGAPFYKSTTGIVRVYDYDYKKNEWVQVGQDLVGPSELILFGHSLSLAADGSVLAIGAPGEWGLTATPGFVRLLQLVDGRWEPIGEDILGDQVGDHFGWSVALSGNGDTLAVGAPVNFEERHGGYVRVVDIKQDQTGWDRASDDLQYKHGTGDWFGSAISLSINGRVLAVGAPGHLIYFNIGKGETGSYVQVYERDGTIWREKGSELKAHQESENFGMAISLDYDGSTLAVGAPFSGTKFKKAGRTQAFRYKEELSEWVAFGHPVFGVEAEALNGWAVALSGGADYMVVGSNRDSANVAFQMGRVHFYRLPSSGD